MRCRPALELVHDDHDVEPVARLVRPTRLRGPREQSRLGAVKIEPLVGKQAQSVHAATASINLWDGSVRSSKTICSLIAWLQFVRRAPAGNLAMVGRTERTLKRNIVDPLVDMVGRHRCKTNWGDGELMLLGRRVYLAGANDVKAEQKIRGITLAGVYVDEVSLLAQAYWSMLRARLSVDGAQLFGTTNPDNPTHWLLKDVLSKAKLHIDLDGRVHTSTSETALDLHRFSFKVRDNPTLPERFVRNLELEYTGLWKKRFVDGLWVLAEGAIYDMFDSSPGGRHVVGALPEIVRWAVAVDYGTTNPFVALLLGEGVDRRVYVAREWRWDSRAERRQLTDSEYSQRLRVWLEQLDPASNERDRECPGARTPDFWFVDPSAASFIQQLHRDGWSGVRGADNDVEDGIREVSTLLSRNRLRVHVSCGAGHRSVGGSENGLIDEKGSYVWDPKAAERGEDKPLKVADHGPDAERYGVRGTSRWWRRWTVGVEAA